MVSKKSIDDAMLLEALKRRMLESIEKQAAQQQVVNNVYGSGSAGSGSQDSGVGRGVHDNMGSPVSPEDKDYWVEIMREDLGQGMPFDPNDPESGTVRGEKGWRKMVHRFDSPKGSTP